MYNIIERYMQNFSKEDVIRFARSKNCELSESESEFTYDFIKKNWQDILKNPDVFDINRYKSHYSEENFKKVKQVFNEYFQKFRSFL